MPATRPQISEDARNLYELLKASSTGFKTQQYIDKVRAAGIKHPLTSLRELEAANLARKDNHQDVLRPTRIKAVFQNSD